MYHPTTRLLTILELLQTRPALRGPELAARLEVDVRTVRRYITMLQDMGIPIEAERGRHGSYGLRPGFKLPPLMFSEEETVALTLGLLIMRRLGLGVDSVAEEGALAKVERVAPAPLRELIAALWEHLVVALPANPPRDRPGREVIKTLSLAVRQQQQVKLTYRAFDGQQTVRTVDPFGLAWRSGSWYLVGFCHLREGMRTFRLDRVLAAHACGQTFEQPEQIDILRHIENAIASTPGTWSIEVFLHTSLAAAERMVPPALATLSAEGEGVALRCYTQQLGWFAHFLAGLSCPFVVRQPAELRDELRRLAVKIIRDAELCS